MRTYSDLAFSWAAVPGAASYRISLGKQKTTNQLGIQDPLTPLPVVSGTSYIPTVTLVGGTWYWQVTPLDFQGTAGTPSPVYEFKKEWNTQNAPFTTTPAATYPTPLTGTNDIDHPESMSLADFELAWEPLPRATLYKVEIFPLDGTASVKCRTANTSVTIVADATQGATDPDRLVGSAPCLWSSSNPITPGTEYRWSVQAVDYSGASTTSIQGAEPTSTLVSETTGPESGDGTRARYVYVTASPAGSPDAIVLNQDALTTATTDAPGQPFPDLKWGAYGFPNAPGKSYGYEVRIYINANRTGEVARARTPSTRLRLTGVLADNTTNQAYYASVTPIEIAGTNWAGSVVQLHDASSTMLHWSRSTTPLTVGPNPVTPKSDGTVVLSWNPESVSGGKDGGSRGYAITISQGTTALGTAKIEYPFYVAQNPATGKPLAEGNTYTFSVAPLDANGDVGRSSAESPGFTISVPPPVPSATTRAVGASAQLSWASSAASASKFTLEWKLSSAAAFTPISALTQTATVLSDLPSGNYDWRVRSVDSANNPSGASSQAHFSIGNVDSSVKVPSLHTPNSAALPLSNRVLSWSPLDGASRYLVQISETSTFTSSTDFETAASSLAIPDARVAAKVYYWRVRALPEKVTTGPSRPILGESETRSFTILSSPAAPSISSVAVSGTSLTANWAALSGANAGTDLPVSYVVQYRVLSSSDDWADVASHATQAAAVRFTAADLATSTTYQFRVAGLNEQGQGPWSAVAKATTAGLPTAAPTNLKVTASLRSMVLSWTAVSGTNTGNSPITGYSVRYRPTGSSGSTNISTSATSATISGLPDATSFDFEVAAMNLVGEGPSAVLTSTTAALAGAPLGFSVKRGDRSAAASWGSPGSDGGSPVTGYQFEQSVYSAATRSWGPWSVSTTTTTSLARSGLINGTNYQFRVAAKTKTGLGAYSPVVSVVPAGKPLAATSLTVKPAKGKFTIKWKAAANNGSAITGYTVQYSANKKKWTVLKTVKGTVKSYVSKKGTKGKKYYFRVVSKNAVGGGPASTVVTSVKK